MFCINLSCIRKLVQKDVLSAAEAELENVLFFELIVTLGFDTLVVQVGAIAGAEVDDVRAYPATTGAIGPCELHQSVQHTERKT